MRKVNSSVRAALARGLAIQGGFCAIFAGYFAASTDVAQGQGQIFFNNRVVAHAPNVIAPVYGLEPSHPNAILQGNATTNGGHIVYTGPLLTGTGYTAALYGGPAATVDPNDLVLIATAPFRPPGLAEGFILQPTAAVRVPGVPGGSYAAFQMRAWDNKDGTLTNWSQVRADPSVARGSSAMFRPPAPLAISGDIPGELFGLESFCLYLPEGGADIIDEPANVTIAPGGAASFSVNVATTAPVNYQWTFNGTALAGANSSGLTIDNAQYPDVGDYRVLVTTSSSVTLTSRVARLVLQPTIVLLEQITIEPWGVLAVRMTYDSTPNHPVHVEANDSPTGNGWVEVGYVSSPVIRGFLFDVFSTNQVRIYRLRVD